METLKMSMRKGCVRSLLGSLAAAFLLAASPGFAAVQYPKVQVASVPGDPGASQLSGDLFAVGSYTSLLLNDTETVVLDGPFESFFLAAETLTEFVPGLLWRYVDGGQLCIGASCAGDMTAGELLTGDIFRSLTVVNRGGGVVEFRGLVDFTGGSLVAGVDRGRIEGFLYNVPNDFSGDFRLAGFVARIGPVNAIPLPSAAWLLIGALPLVARIRKV